MSDTMLLCRTIEALERTGRFRELKQYSQHGSFTVYDHSLGVARMSLGIARRLPFRIDYASLVRGALLHDYFLYDWHIHDPDRPNHALFHPRIAFNNARRDYGVNATEADIIRRHMFPLNPIPPKTIEGWIVCWVDTYCALRETVNLNRARQIIRTVNNKFQQKRRRG